MRKLRGASFIEVIIAMSLFVLIVGMSIPTIQHFKWRTDCETSLQTFLSLIQAAKQMSLMQHADVGVNVQNNLMQVFWDNDHDGQVHDPAQIILSQPLIANSELTWQTFPSYRDYLLFTSDEVDNGTVYFCLRHQPAWLVTLDKAGNVRTKTDGLRFAC